MEHVILGVPVHNRSTSDHKQTLGMFSSMIPLRINVDLQQPFAHLLRQIGSELRQCYRHQRFPIAELNRHLNLHQQGRRQLFDISFSLEVFPTDIELEGSQFKVENMHHGHEQLPLGIYLRHYLPGDDPLLEFNLNQAWFSQLDGELIATRIIKLLDDLLDGDATLPLGQLPLLLPVEQQQIFHQWNNTHQSWEHATKYPSIFRTTGFVHTKRPCSLLRTPFDQLSSIESAGQPVCRVLCGSKVCNRMIVLHFALTVDRKW